MITEKKFKIYCKIETRSGSAIQTSLTEGLFHNEVVDYDNFVIPTKAITSAGNKTALMTRYLIMKKFRNIRIFSNATRERELNPDDSLQRMLNNTEITNVEASYVIAYALYHNEQILFTRESETNWKIGWRGTVLVRFGRDYYYNTMSKYLGILFCIGQRWLTNRENREKFKDLKRTNKGLGLIDGVLMVANIQNVAIHMSNIARFSQEEIDMNSSDEFGFYQTKGKKTWSINPWDIEPGGSENMLEIEGELYADKQVFISGEHIEDHGLPEVALRSQISELQTYGFDFPPIVEGSPLYRFVGWQILKLHKERRSRNFKNMEEWIASESNIKLKRTIEDLKAEVTLLKEEYMWFKSESVGTKLRKATALLNEKLKEQEEEENEEKGRGKGKAKEKGWKKSVFRTVQGKLTAFKTSRVIGYEFASVIITAESLGKKGSDPRSLFVYLNSLSPSVQVDEGDIKELKDDMTQIESDDVMREVESALKRADELRDPAMEDYSSLMLECGKLKFKRQEWKKEAGLIVREFNDTGKGHWETKGLINSLRQVDGLIQSFEEHEEELREAEVNDEERLSSYVYWKEDSGRYLDIYEEEIEYMKRILNIPQVVMELLYEQVEV